MLSKSLITGVLLIATSTANSQWEMWGVGGYGGRDQLGVVYRLVGEEFEVIKHFSYDHLTHSGISDGFRRLPTGVLWMAARMQPGSDNALMVSYDPATGTFSEWATFTESAGRSPSGNFEPLGNNLLIGSCEFGGIGDAGTIVSYSISGEALVRLHDLGPDGLSRPTGGLVLHLNGLLYGVATEGGNNGYGALFSFDSSVNEVAYLHHFSLENGTGRCSPLTIGSDGTLFGTRAGDVNGGGTLFSFDPATDAFQLRFSFDGSSGRLPEGKLLVGPSGSLWGISIQDTGISRGRLFSFDPATDSYEQLFNFNGGISGRPLTSPVFTAAGQIAVLTASVSGPGAPPAKFWAFDATSGEPAIQTELTGALPIGLCDGGDGLLYGIGGRSVLRINAAGTKQTAALLSLATRGMRPSSQLIETTSGKIVGLCAQGGVHNRGSLFKIDPFTQAYDTIVSLPPNAVIAVEADLKEHQPDQILCIIPSVGGGGLVNIDLSNGTINELVSFEGTMVQGPSTAFLKLGSLVYGTALSGGQFGKGCMWRFDMNSLVLEILHSFGPYPGFGYLTPSRPCELPDGRIMGTVSYDDEGPSGWSSMYIYSPTDASVVISHETSDNSTAYLFQHGFVRTSSGQYWGTLQRVTSLPAGSGVTRYDPSTGLLGPTFIYDNYLIGGPLVVDEMDRLILSLNNINFSPNTPTLLRVNTTDGSSDELHLFTDYGEGRSLLGNILLTSIGVGVGDDPPRSTLQLYPNPTSGQFTFSLPEGGPYTLRILDTNGRVLIEQFGAQGRSTMNISTLADGVYFVVLGDASSNISVQRIVKVVADQ